MAEAWQYFQADAEKKIEALEAVNAQLVVALEEMVEAIEIFDEFELGCLPQYAVFKRSKPPLPRRKRNNPSVI